jgi:osmoprotectant transport system substrate-binding protein
VTRRRTRLTLSLVGLVAATGVLAGCADSDPGPPGPPPVVVGAGPGPESAVLAEVYAAALRSAGRPARVQSEPDPLAALDPGDIQVAPGFTGQILTRLDPQAAPRAAEPVYRAMIAALPEGLAAGDYAQSAMDKPTVLVTAATARSWGRRDAGGLEQHCAGLRVGRIAGPEFQGVDVPTRVATCRLGAPVDYPDIGALLAALRTGRIDAAWITSVTVPSDDDLVALADRTAAIRAQNVVPVYRRNELSEGQVLALNQVAGELDTAALAAMIAQVRDGANPAVVADEWLAVHPLGH